MLISIRTIIVLSALLVAHTTTLRADLVSVGTVGSVGVSPGGQSGTITVPVFNDTGTAATMLAWTLGLRIVPLNGATGTVTLVESSVAYPTSGTNIFPTVFPVAKPTIGDNNPAAGDYTFSASDGTFTGVTVPNSATGKAMMTFQVSASANASGTFALQLVDPTGQSNTFWNDQDNNAREFLVNNAAFVSGVEIGQFSVAAAVPEPGSLLLTGSVALIAGWRARRKRRAAAEATLSTTATPEIA
jgi:hypothetical protein